jgi:hypothetical protein
MAGIYYAENMDTIAPQLIENIFRESPFIDQIMVIGEHQKFPSALIAPDFRYFEYWKKSEHITVSSNEELIGSPAVQAIFSSEKMQEVLPLHPAFNQWISPCCPKISCLHLPEERPGAVSAGPFTVAICAPCRPCGKKQHNDPLLNVNTKFLSPDKFPDVFDFPDQNQNVIRQVNQVGNFEVFPGL